MGADTWWPTDQSWGLGLICQHRTQPGRPTKWVVTAGAQYNYGITPLGLKSERSLRVTLPAHSGPIMACIIRAGRSFSFLKLSQVKHVSCILPLLTQGCRCSEGGAGDVGEKGDAKRAGEVRVWEGTSSGSCFRGCIGRDFCSSLAPDVTACSCFQSFGARISCPNQMIKKKRHTTRTLLSISPPLQVSIFIFLPLNKHIKKDIAFFFKFRKTKCFLEMIFFSEKRAASGLRSDFQIGGVIVPSAVGVGLRPQCQCLNCPLTSSPGGGRDWGTLEGGGSLSPRLSGFNLSLSLAHWFGKNSITSIILQICTKYLLHAKLFQDAGCSGFSDFSLAFQWV